MRVAACQAPGIDSWFPHQLSALSEQLTIRNGIYLMGGAALATLLYTGGDVHQLVVMYSINVFLTFTLSNLAMCRHWQQLGDGESASSASPVAPRHMDPEASTAVVLVGGYSGLGLHTLLQLERVFTGQFRQAVFISVGVVDSGSFKGVDEIDALRLKVAMDLERYVEFAERRLGWAADSDLAIGTDAVFELERLCRQVYLRFPRSVFVAGQMVVRQPTWWYRLLHNETAFAVQRRLQFDRLPMVILPTRVL